MAFYEFAPLMRKIDRALQDDIDYKPPETAWELWAESVFSSARAVAGSAAFGNLITVSIVFVAVSTGVETVNFNSYIKKNLF